jgi:4-hydroxy-3-methylbut-2-enyl diphosphate reductase IspH
VVLAQPRGLCAGVDRAIAIVERALRKYGPPIYVRHEIVHNRHVVADLRARSTRSRMAPSLSSRRTASPGGSRK